MEYFSKARISRSGLAHIKHLLSYEPKNENECFGEDETISVTAKYPNGYQMDIKLCGVQYREGESNLPWTEAVLFDENCSQVAVTDPYDEFDGSWVLYADGVEYNALVVECEDEL